MSTLDSFFSDYTIEDAKTIIKNAKSNLEIAKPLDAKLDYENLSREEWRELAAIELVTVDRDGGKTTYTFRNGAYDDLIRTANAKPEVLLRQLNDGLER